MVRLIDANKFEAFIEKIPFVDVPGYTEGYAHGMERVLEEIDAAPTIDAVPLVYGDWRVIEVEADGTALLECGVCKERYVVWNIPYCKYLPNFCPNCGAKRRLAATCKEATE